MTMSNRQAVRRNRWRDSHRRPAPMSAPRLVREVELAGRYRPGSDQTMAAAAAKLTASAAVGIYRATPYRSAPIGAPINVELTVCTPISQELARSSRPGETSCGTIADAALSNRVSAAPSRNDRTAKDTIVVALVTRTAVNAPTATARTVSVVHITLRRSCRSTTAPPSSPNSGQGRYPFPHDGPGSGGSDRCPGT